MTKFKRKKRKQQGSPQSTPDTNIKELGTLVPRNFDFPIPEPDLTKKKTKWTPNKKIFADQWIKHRNATRAYAFAYPNVKNDNSAGVLGFALLRDVKVNQYIRAKFGELCKKVQIDQEYIMEGYRKLLEFDLDDIYDEDGELKPLSQMSANAKFAIQSIKRFRKKTVKKKANGDSMFSESVATDLKLTDKKAIFDSLAQIQGLMKQDGEGTQSPNQQFNIQINFTDEKGNVIDQY